MRLEGWEKRLEKYLSDCSSKPFEWGVLDCVLFASRGAQEVLGQSLEDKIETYGIYDKAGAVKILREHDGEIGKIFDKHLKRIAIKSNAKRGDIVVVLYDGAKAAGIIDLTGRRVAVKSAIGVDYIPISHVIASWEVG